MTTKIKPLLVTTTHKGVFFGYGHYKEGDKEITLTDAQNCVYWSAQVRGVFGLAVTGPTSSCKIGPKVPTLTIKDVTSIAETTQEAAKAWSKCIWG
jgi:hypothetical protein